MLNPKTHGAVARRARLGLPITRSWLKREFPRLNWREINKIYEEVTNVDSNHSRS